MNKLLLFLLAFVATPCLAASPIIYQGNNSKDLTSGGLITQALYSQGAVSIGGTSSSPNYVVNSLGQVAIGNGTTANGAINIYRAVPNERINLQGDSSVGIDFVNPDGVTNTLMTVDGSSFRIYPTTASTHPLTIQESTGNVSLQNGSTPAALSVGQSNQFQINSTGNVTKLNNVTTSFPSSQATAGQMLQNDGSGNLSWTTLTTPSPVAYSQAPVAITAVGTAGFPQLGHVLDSNDFGAMTTAQYAFFNLSANANDGNTTGAHNLTPNGTPTYTTTNVLGTANAAATLNGTTQYYSSTNAFFNPGNGKSFAVGGWFKATSWTGGSYGLIFQYGTGSDKVFGLETNPNTNIAFYATNTAATWDTIATAPWPSGLTGWHHFALVYDFSQTKLFGYLDGKLIASATQANVRSATSANLTVGQVSNTEFFNGSAEDVFFINNYAATADDIRKLAARRIDHNKNIATNNQLWTANWGRSDSTVATQLDASWLVSKSSTSLWADFSGVATGAFVDLSMQNIGQYGTALVPNATYDSGVLSATPSTTIAHGLGARPVNIVYQYETTTGHFTPLQGSNFCEADSTNLYCDWTGLSVSASNRLEIIAGGVPLLSAVPLADATTNGIINSNGAQTIGGAKTFNGQIIPNGGIAGNTSATVPGAGNIGERVKGTTLGSVAVSGCVGTGVQVASIALTAGNWLLYAHCPIGLGSMTGLNAVDMAVSATSGNNFVSVGDDDTCFVIGSAQNTANPRTNLGPCYYQTVSSATLYLNAGTYCSSAGTGAFSSCQVYGIRQP